MSSYWGTCAMRTIEAEMRAHLANDPLADRQELLRHINTHHYPFGERRMWPYTAWRKAVRAYRKALMAIPDTAVTVRCPDTIDMFTEEATL